MSVVRLSAVVALAVFYLAAVGCTNRATPPRDTVTFEGHCADLTDRFIHPKLANRMLSAGEAPAQL
jgi:hypothetical protein